MIKSTGDDPFAGGWIALPDDFEDQLIRLRADVGNGAERARRGQSPRRRQRFNAESD